jgi:hypothetical protein
MEVLAKYKLRSPTRVLLRQFPYILTSPTPVGVVTTGVGHGPCPNAYPRKCTLCALSRGPGSDKPPSSS